MIRVQVLDPHQIKFNNKKTVKAPRKNPKPLQRFFICKAVISIKCGSNRLEAATAPSRCAAFIARLVRYIMIPELMDHSHPNYGFILGAANTLSGAVSFNYQPVVATRKAPLLIERAEMTQKQLSNTKHAERLSCSTTNKC